MIELKLTSIAFFDKENHSLFIMMINLTKLIITEDKAMKLVAVSQLTSFH